MNSDQVVTQHPVRYKNCMTKQRHIIGYVRVSTTEQAKEGYSLDAQEADIRAYCEKQGWTLKEVIREEGVSGGTTDRPGLARLHEMIAKRQVSHVVIKSLDRMSRDIRDRLLPDLVKARVDLVSTTENIDLTTIDGEQNALLLQFVATLERLAIKRRTLAALKHMKRQGLRTGAIPYGFDVAEDGRHLVANAAEQAVVARARDLRNSGMALLKIAHVLRDDGHHSRTGKVFAASQIQRMVEMDRAA